ncbi:MAG: PQQ-binding-like beta-propeller repeat protein [Anaerolineae bacterium]|nr:PQQ-binding-like beta-propeller repeat protein [Anaerolineae bacterium]
MGQLTTRQLASKRNRQKATAKARLQPGDMLQDRYRIVGTLGSGGFSSVYKARDMRFPNVTKLCAIKEMVISAPDPQMRELTIKSFEREASMLAMLDHPAIPDVSDYFTEEDRSYLVLDLIRGKDLDQWLEESTDLLDQTTAVEWAIQLCDALEHLHNQRPQPIVFRDVKPSNIMLDQYGRIVLIDFGIAKVFETGDKGTMIGTEGYSPPEQYRGRAEPAGDIYALGATLHHLLTKKDPRLEPPFTFNERPIAQTNPNVSPEFEAIIMRCLAYDPVDRYPNAQALKMAVEALRRPGLAATAVSTPATAATAFSNIPAGTAVVTPTTNAATPAVSQIKPVWTFRCEDEIRRRVAVANGMAFVSAYDNNLYALSQAKGEFIWKFPALDNVGGSAPFVYEENIFIGSVDRHLYSIQTRTGRQNWRFATGGPIYTSPRVRFDHAFFGSDDGHFYAVNVRTGRSAWKARAYSPVRSTPYVDDERVFFGTEGGYIFCLELASGKTVWQAQAKRNVTSSPTLANEIVYIGSHDATMYALDATSGYVIWRFRARRPIVASPIVYDTMVFIGSADGNLYALDTESGRQLWSFETKGQVTSSPAVSHDAVYIGSTDGTLYCLSLRRGDLRWRFDTDGRFIASPVVMDDMIFIGSSNHTLYALPA